MTKSDVVTLIEDIQSRLTVHGDGATGEVLGRAKTALTAFVEILDLAEQAMATVAAAREAEQAVPDDLMIAGETVPSDANQDLETA